MERFTTYDWILAQVELGPILGNQVNVDEFYYMLDLVEQTNFRRLPRLWRSKAKRRGAARYVFADYMYYDPYRLCSRL